MEKSWRPRLLATGSELGFSYPEIKVYLRKSAPIFFTPHSSKSEKFNYNNMKESEAKALAAFGPEGSYASETVCKHNILFHIQVMYLEFQNTCMNFFERLF